MPKKTAKKSGSDSPTVIYLVRHGESEYNKLGILGGHANPTLTENGLLQAKDAKKLFSSIKIDHVYSSDLDRAVTTAEIVSGLPVHPDNRLKSLREKNWGSLEGQPYRAADDYTTTRVNLSKQASWDYKHIEDMESDKELSDRFMPELKNIAERHAGKTVLVGSHGTAIRIVIMILENKHYSEYANRHFRNGGYLKLIYKDGIFTIDEVYGYN